jgi:hypothetical protein
MLGPLLRDLESLEAISQDGDTRRIFLRMAAMSQDGRLSGFLAELARDDDLDEAAKGQLTELAQDRASSSPSRSTCAGPSASIRRATLRTPNGRLAQLVRAPL